MSEVNIVSFLPASYKISASKKLHFAFALPLIEGGTGAQFVKLSSFSKKFPDHILARDLFG